MLITWGISEAIQALYALVDAQNHVAQASKNFGDSIKTIASSMEGYQNNISSYTKILKDDNSTTEQRVKARQDLIKAQKELLEQYGKEPAAVDAINQIIDTATGKMGDYRDIIDATSNSWKKLGDSAVREAERAINAQDTWKQRFANWFLTGETQSTKAALKQYENFGKYQGFVVPGGNSQRDKEMRDYVYSLNPKIIEGDAEDVLKIYEQIVAKAETLGYENEAWLKGIRENINKAQDLIDDTSVFRSYNAEKIVNANYSDIKKQIDDLYDQYNKALAENEIDKADSIEKQIVSKLKSVEDTAISRSQKGVKNWFADTYSEFQRQVDSADFADYLNQSFEKNIQRGIGSRKITKTYAQEFKDQLNNLKFGNRDATVEDLQGMSGLLSTGQLDNDSTHTQQQIEAFKQLAFYATQAGYSIEEVIYFLNQIGEVDTKNLQDAKIKFSVDDEATQAAINKYLDGLSEADLEILLSIDDSKIEKGSINVEYLKQKLEEAKQAVKALNDEADKTKDAFNFTKNISDLKDLEDELNKLGTAMSNIDENGQFQLGDLDSIADYFLAIEEAGGKASYKAQEVGDALKLLGEGTGSIEQQADAINTLADQYIRTSNVLEGLNEQNRQLYITRLEEMGIINAETIVEQELLASKNDVINAETVEIVTTMDLTNVTESLVSADEDAVNAATAQIQALLDETNATDATRAAVFNLVAQQTIFNQTGLSVNDKIDALNKLASAFLGTAEAAKFAAKASSLSAEASNLEKAAQVGGTGISSDWLKKRKAEIENKVNSLSSDYSKSIASQTVQFEKAQYNGGSPVKSKLGKSPTSTAGALKDLGNKAIKDAADKAAKGAKDDEKELEDTYDEFFDYFERRVKVLTDAISLLDAHLENVVGSAAKNKLLDAQERIYKMQQQEYADAKRMYEEMANKALAKIPDNIKNDIINGAVAIDEFIGKGNEEVVQAMQDYTKWADKIAECKQQLAELKEQLRQLELKRFKNIAQDWQDLFDLRQNNAIDLIDKQIDLFEEAGQLIGKSFYEEQKAQAQKQYELLSNERKALVDELNRGLSNGTIEIGSDEWLEMRSILSDLEGQILDCAKAIETFDNAILQLHVDVFERIQGQLDDFDDQLSDMASFLDDADVSNKYGEWSQEGMARAGLLAQQFDLANKKVHDYAEEIEWLNEQYKLGKYSTTEYMDRLADLMSEQRDAAQTADDMKDAMVELNRDRVDIVIDGINEEIKAYEELIDAQKKALQAQKDLHDYEKQVADENKAIVDIERQLAAIRNDDSAAANAKRKQLEAQLKDAQDQLSETEYDHSITAQEDALDAQMEQYRQMREAEIQSWEEYAANIEQVMIDMLAMVQANAFEIGTVITETATAHGFQISQALTDPWFTAQQTIAQYGEVLSAETSSFIASLESVEQETWNLQAQADATSVQLAQMFGNRADNLVNELQRSWESEQNLANMTHALSDAFVQALDSGYRIGEVVNPLESAKAATDALADAADSAASAFDGMADSARRAAQEAANANSMPTTASRGTPYSPPTEHVSTIYSPGSPAIKWHKDAYGNIKTRYYAKGLSKAEEDQLAWTQELGDEVIVSPTRSSILTPIKKGDAVIDAKGTQNLFELAKVDPKQLLNGMSSASTPTLQQNKAISLHFDSAIQVNGNVNDTLQMAKIAGKEVQSGIANTLKELSDEIKY